MTQEKDKLINLSVHESVDPSQFSSEGDKQAPENLNDLNDSVHNSENADASTSQPFDDGNEENLGEQQITIANLSAG
ncbi:hypothetical protein H6G76_16300 [Nostoc sp. FACHB-152]|uniref:hypothetical protein n=1 Tax=unclassified Nostoc TaxID=2593658 RepID=UPI00168888AD|nr:MULTISPECIES: hypothetical protein [unclassified Nostoc]MBD2448685.1 hypothetical protein [Nostoc sp. FACHB-152]MBD2468330.1 hypothetical protein [Nostoc sp. FACHB-145]